MISTNLRFDLLFENFTKFYLISYFSYLFIVWAIIIMFMIIVIEAILKCFNVVITTIYFNLVNF